MFIEFNHITKKFSKINNFINNLTKKKIHMARRESEKNINMISFRYTFIKHPSFNNLVNLQNKLDIQPNMEDMDMMKNYSICVIGEKNVGKSLLISRLIVIK